jgi:hypothetical protein
VEITGEGSPSEGTVIEVASWAGNALTGLSGITADDATDYTIRAAKTVADVFGATNDVATPGGLTASANADPSEASIVYIPKSGGGFTRLFYSTFVGDPNFQGWLDADTFAKAEGMALNYVDGVVVQEVGGTNLSLVVTGMVKTSSTLLPVTESFTYLGTAYPVGSTLGNSGLENSVAASANADPSEADVVYLPKADASGFNRYFFSTFAGDPNFAGWLDADTFAQSADAGLTSGIIIDQNGTGGDFNAPIVAPPFYANL